MQAFIRTNQDLKQLLTLPSPTPPPATGSSKTSTRTAKAKPRYDKSGTTATIAMVFRGRRLLVANVGDSRAVLCCDAGGAPLELTVDHVASDPEVREHSMPLIDMLYYETLICTHEQTGTPAAGGPRGARHSDKQRHRYHGSCRWGERWGRVAGGRAAGAIPVHWGL